VRRARLLSEAGDPSVAAVLLDFVLGFGAAADPVGDLADGDRVRSPASVG